MRNRERVEIVSSTGALSLKQVPKKMILIGAGVIGVELVRPSPSTSLTPFSSFRAVCGNVWART